MDGRLGKFKILIFLLLALNPSFISNYNFVSKSLSLKISKNSPPIAILEDELIPFSETQAESEVRQENLELPKINSNLLKAVAQSFHKRKNFNLDENVQKNTIEEKLVTNSENSILETRISFIPINRISINQNLNQEKPSLSIKKENKVRTLSGMSLDKKSPNVVMIKKSLGQNSEEETKQVLKIANQSQTQTKTRSISSQVFQKRINNTVSSANDDFDKLMELKSGNLNLEQQARLEALLPNEVFEVTQAETFEDYAQNVLEQIEIKEKNLNVENQKSFPVAMNLGEESKENNIEAKSKPLFTIPGWLVGAPQVEVKQEASSLPRPAFGWSEKTKIKSNKAPLQIAQNIDKSKNELTVRNEVKSGNIIQASTSKKLNLKDSLYQNPPQQLYISGAIELTQGLALLGNEVLQVYHKVGGVVSSYGSVHLDKGQYEILIENPKAGVLVAEVEKDNFVIGKAELLIPELLMNAKKTGDLKSTPLLIKPTKDNLSIQAQSAAHIGKSIPVQKVFLSDYYNLKSRNNNFTGQFFESTFISKAEKESFWNSLKFVSSKENFFHTLFPESTVQALFALANKRYSDQKGAVHGVVKIQGQLVSGATVEILNEDETPVYYNSFLPDASLTATTSNGSFSFVGLEKGIYILKAKYQNKYLSSQVIQVEQKTISEVEFDVQAPKLAEAFVFDMRTNQLIPSELQFLGAEKSVSTQSGRQLVSLSGSVGVQVLQANPIDENYLSTRMTIDKSQKEILIPIIHREWMNALLTRMKYNPSISGSGIIMGTSHKNSFQIELDPRAYNEETQILYFDSQGRMLDGAIEAPPQGGVIVLNVNSGLRSAFLKYQNQEAQKIITMAVSEEAVNIFNSPF